MGLPAWRDRIEDGEREIEEAGGKLVGVWVTLGRYDVVEVFEAPDDDTALEIVTKLSHHGAEQTETLRAFTRDEAEGIIKRALGERFSATVYRRSRISAASAPTSSRRGSSERLSSPKTRSKSGVVR